MKAGVMASKKKVLLLASVASMIDQFNMQNIRLLQEMGYEVHVACNFKEGNTCDASRIRLLQETLRGMGVAMHPWDCPRKLYSLSGCMRAYRQVRRLVRQYPVDWIHCQSPIGGALARIAAHRAGIPVLYTAHGFHFYQGAPWINWLLYYPAEKLLSYWTDALITVNKEDYRFARRRLRAGKAYYIPGVGIDTAYFGRTKEKSGAGGQPEEGLCAGDQAKKERKRFCEKYKIPPDACVLLSVGELNKGKNHRMVIDALAKMPETQIYYLVCGQGKLKKELLCRARRRGVEDRLRLPGYQEGMADIYRNADIFVFPSVREGMPVALMEAMAACLPCVVSDIRGSRELLYDAGQLSVSRKRLRGAGKKKRIQRDTGSIRRRGGFCFSLDKPPQLVYALRCLVNDVHLRKKCGMYNRRKIEGYDQARVNGRMRKIYAEFDKSGKGGRVLRKKDGQPLVSVIMPVFNMAGDPALPAAVSSVLRQDYQNWELILCDDGSTDGTQQVLRQLASMDGMDGRARIIRNAENRGAGAARNACIRAARGTYLAIMDADDLSHPKRLKKQAAFLEGHPEYALVGSNAWMRDRHGVWGRRRVEQEPCRESFLSTLPFIHPSVMLRMEAVKNLHGYSTARLARRAEDYELLMRLYAAGYRGFNLQQELVSYLEEQDSYRKRKYRYRIAECVVRLQGFHRLGLNAGLRYVLKPLAVGLVPGWIQRMYRKKKFSYKQTNLLQKNQSSRKNSGMK